MVMGPVMPMVVPRVRLAVLLLLPIVKPETPLPNDQLLPKVCAEPKLLEASKDNTLTVPVVLNVAVLFRLN